MKGSPDISDAALCAEYQAVLRYVLALTGDRLEAEDITQETFLRALEAKEQFTGGSSLYTWLCSIAKNRYFSRCRRQSRNAGSELLEALPDTSRVDEMIADKSTSMQIMRAVHRLRIHRTPQSRG